MPCGTGHVIYMEPCEALERELGRISGTATCGQGDRAVPGVPVLPWSQAVQVTMATMVSWNKYTDYTKVFRT